MDQWSYSQAAVWNDLLSYKEHQKEIKIALDIKKLSK